MVPLVRRGTSIGKEGRGARTRESKREVSGRETAERYISKERAGQGKAEARYGVRARRRRAGKSENESQRKRGKKRKEKKRG